MFRCASIHEHEATYLHSMSCGLNIAKYARKVNQFHDLEFENVKLNLRIQYGISLSAERVISLARDSVQVYLGQPPATFGFFFSITL